MTTAAICPMKWAEEKTDDNKTRCACCDRVIRKIESAKWVEVINGGDDCAAPGLGVDTSDPGYMGLFLVGATCARKHFPGFTHDYDDPPCADYDAPAPQPAPAAASNDSDDSEEDAAPSATEPEPPAAQQVANGLVNAAADLVAAVREANQEGVASALARVVSAVEADVDSWIDAYARNMCANDLVAEAEDIMESLACPESVAFPVARARALGLAGNLILAAHYFMLEE